MRARVQPIAKLKVIQNKQYVRKLKVLVLLRLTLCRICFRESENSTKIHSTKELLTIINAQMGRNSIGLTNQCLLVIRNQSYTKY